MCSRFWFLILVLIIFVGNLSADSVEHWAEVEAIFNRIHSNLKKSEQEMLSPTLKLDPKAPFGCVTCKDGNRVQITFSPHYLQFLNAAAQCSAAASKKRGYLIDSLHAATLNAEGAVLLPPQPDAGALNLKSDEYENLLLTKLNQLVGGILAMQAAHVCLHHDTSSEDHPVAISEATRNLDEKRWRKILEHGVMSAVSCAYNTESLCEFYEALDSLQPRPEWVDHFLPRTVKGKKTAKDTHNLQQKLMR